MLKTGANFTITGQVTNKRTGTSDRGNDWFRITVAVMGGSYDMYVEPDQFNKVAEGQPVKVTGDITSSGFKIGLNVQSLDVVKA